jgi:hypothetical protein
MMTDMHVMSIFRVTIELLERGLRSILYSFLVLVEGFSVLKSLKRKLDLKAIKLKWCTFNCS